MPISLDDMEVLDESLEAQLIAANKLLKELSLDELSFDEKSDCGVVDADSLVCFEVPEADPFFVRAGDALEFVTAAAGTWDGTDLKTPLQRFVHMGALNDAAKDLSYHAWNRSYEERPAFAGYFTRDAESEAVGFRFAVVVGATPVALRLYASGIYDDGCPPYDTDEIYVWIRHDKPVSEAQVARVFNAYLFELSATANIELTREGRIARGEFEGDTTFEGLTAKGERLRALVVGPGTGEATELFVDAMCASDPRHRVLGFAKVIEHVSATVIRLEGLKQIRTKLMSPHAAAPDVKYISELWTLVEKQGEYKEERRAFELTVRTCCDADDLRRIAPPCCIALRNLTDDAEVKTRTHALNELANRISATRNQVAHAKANYTPSNLECPEEELFEFAALVQTVAAQCIRWYADSDPKLRASRHGSVE